MCGQPAGWTHQHTEQPTLQRLWGRWTHSQKLDSGRSAGALTLTWWYRNGGYAKKDKQRISTNGRRSFL